MPKLNCLLQSCCNLRSGSLLRDLTIFFQNIKDNKRPSCFLLFSNLYTSVNYLQLLFAKDTNKSTIRKQIQIIREGEKEILY
jgi:hypothetical protein